jgi:hypothetical protein
MGHKQQFDLERCLNVARRESLEKEEERGSFVLPVKSVAQALFTVRL